MRILGNVNGIFGRAHQTINPQTNCSSRVKFGGGFRIRTGEWRFCRPLPYHLAKPPEYFKSLQTPARIHSHRNYSPLLDKKKAGDGTRTRDNHLGKVELYQLSYSRIANICVDQYIGKSFRVNRIFENCVVFLKISLISVR